MKINYHSVNNFFFGNNFGYNYILEIIFFFLEIILKIIFPFFNIKIKDNNYQGWKIFRFFYLSDFYLVISERKSVKFILFTISIIYL